MAAPPRKKAPKKKSASAVGRLRGHGDYTYDKPGPWGRIGRSLGEHAGGMIGSSYGMKGVGQALGSKLGSYAHYIGKIFGSGDYVTSAGQVKHNTLVNDSQIPSFGSSKNEVRLRHREFLGDIISSATIGAYNNQSFPINPGLMSSFPWLANVVGSTFQQYRINGMVFEYRSMSADALNSTNTALGSVVMATDYDSKDAIFTSKQQMENSEFGVSCKPSSCMIHGIECARSQTSVSELYIRAFAVPSGADPRLYDMGNFQIATVGCQAASVNLGELWVSYDISVLKAIEQPPGYSSPLDDYTLTAVDATHSLGTSLSTNLGTVNQIGTTLTQPAGTAYINFPYLYMTKGMKFCLSYRVVGDSTAGVAICTPVATGGLAAIGDIGFSSPATSTATTLARAVNEYYVYDGTGTAAVPPQIAIPGGVVPANITKAELLVCQVGAALV